MQRGWAPKTEKTKAAMKEETRTSATPYWPVVSMRSREKAMPGRTLMRGERERERERDGGVRSALGAGSGARETHLAKKMRAVAGTTL